MIQGDEEYSEVSALNSDVGQSHNRRDTPGSRGSALGPAGGRCIGRSRVEIFVVAPAAAL